MHLAGQVDALQQDPLHPVALEDAPSTLQVRGQRNLVAVALEGYQQEPLHQPGVSQDEQQGSCGRTSASARIPRLFSSYKRW